MPIEVFGAILRVLGYRKGPNMFGIKARRAITPAGVCHNLMYLSDYVCITTDAQSDTVLSSAPHRSL